MGITDFIKNIQNSDDATKRKWLVIFSGGTMALVIALWLFSFSALAPAPEGAKAARAAPEKPGIWKTFAAGVSVIWSDIEARLLRKETISLAEDRNFIADDMPEIPPTPLP